MWFTTDTYRIFFALALFASVVFAPWWLALLFALALTVRFRAWEVIAAGIFFDLLWMPGPIALAWDSLPYATIIAAVLLLGFDPLRRQLLLGPHVL